MLLALHVALLAGVGNAVAASLMTTHLGLFFLWQPIWQRDQRLDLASTALIALFAATFVIILNWWVVFVWLTILIGIVAGRSLLTRRERYAYMLTLAFLITELLIESVPHVFEVGTLNRELVELFRVVLLAVPFLLLWIPSAPAGSRTTFPIDFFRGITIALMTALLALGSVLMTHQNATDYATALFFSLLALSGFLLLISWLLTPTSGGGLSALWEKSLLNIGTPFEAWITDLAGLAERERSPLAFLEAAITRLVEMPWLTGVNCNTLGLELTQGQTATYHTRLETKDLTVTLYLERPMGSALLLHCRLLIQILGHFYSAKLREQEQANQAHLRAVHETGARLTHDIKNLLQSLKLSAGEVQEQTPVDPQREGERLALLRRQLPHITQRLQLTLDKLQQPEPSASSYSELGLWWQRLNARQQSTGLRLSAQLENPATLVPADCLDSVIENLLDNSRQKALREPGLAIDLTLLNTGDEVTIRVGDSGRAIAPQIAQQLFIQAVNSDSGLGIGLYQARRQAESQGYRLCLSVNRDGRVEFELSNRRTE